MEYVNGVYIRGNVCIKFQFKYVASIFGPLLPHENQIDDCWDTLKHRWIGQWIYCHQLKPTISSTSIKVLNPSIPNTANTPVRNYGIRYEDLVVGEECDDEADVDSIWFGVLVQFQYLDVCDFWTRAGSNSSLLPHMDQDESIQQLLYALQIQDDT